MDEELDLAGDWHPTRWWRVLASDGSLWCETSDEEEARDRMRSGDQLEHLYERTKSEWRVTP